MAATSCANLTSADIGSTVSCIQDTISTTLSTNQTALVTEGSDLAAMLLLVTVSISLLMWALTTDGASALAESFSALARYFVVVVLLAGWTSPVGDFFNSNINSLASKVGGPETPGQGVTMMAGAVVALFAHVDSANEPVNCRPDPYAAPGEVPQPICDPPPGGSGKSPSVWDMVLLIPALFYQIMLKGLAAVFLILMTAAYLLAVVMAQALFGIGMIVGPILVAGLVWERTEFLFDGWLRFMLSAAMTKIVAAIMVAVMVGVITATRALAGLVDGTAALNRVDLVAAYILAAVAAVGAFMMWQVQGIAQSLLTGGSGAKSSGFGKGAVGGSVKGMLFAKLLKGGK